MGKSSVSAAGDESESTDPGSRAHGERGTRRARPSGQRRWPYGWVAAPVLAALVVARASAVPLPAAGTGAQAAAVAGLLAGAAVLAVTPGVAVLSVAARYRRLGPATALGLLYAGAGIAAMAGFWAWFAGPAFGTVLDAVLLAVSVAVIAVAGRRGDLGRLGLTLPLALALAVSVLYTGIAFLRGGPTANPWENLGHLLWPAPDNEIPLLFAARLAAHAPLRGYLLSAWLSSDRPPLQTGFVLLQWPLWHASGPWRGYQFSGTIAGGYQFLGTVLQSAWLPALWIVFRVRGISVRRTCTAVLATAATGVMYMNTVYVWPKMLAGALALCALAILLSRDPGDRCRSAGLLAAALAALSMLAHGGTCFGLLAFVMFVNPWRRTITAGAVAACTAVMAALYVPWMLYQHFVSPPGDRLLKWMLAGVIPADGRGVLRALIDQYRSLSLLQVLDNKGGNAQDLVLNMRLLTGRQHGWSGSLGTARVTELYFLVPAAGLLLLGALALPFAPARRLLAGVRPLAAVTALTLAVWVALIFGGRVPAVIHQGPYVALILFIGLLALAVTALPPVPCGAVLVAIATWFVVEWLPGLTFRPQWLLMPARPVDWSMAVLCGCALAVITAIVLAARGKRARR